MKKVDINNIKSYGKFAVILKCLLMKNDITQGELAKMTGLSGATITHYIKRNTTPSQKNVDKIASALNVSPRVFYGDIDEFAPYLNRTESVFSKRLNNLLNEKGITQEQLAKEIGVTRQSVNQYVNGKQLPMSDILGKIADYFGVKMEALIDTQQEREETPMKVMVSQMPTKKRECLFIKGDYTTEYCECLLGGMCDLNEGICSKLLEEM